MPFALEKGRGPRPDTVRRLGGAAEKGGLSSLKQVKWAASHVLELVAGTAFLIMITVVFANVMLRFTTGKSLVWTEEVAAIGFIWTIFLGAAVCYKDRGGLISVDMLVTMLPGRSEKCAALVIDAFQIVVCVVLCGLGWKFAVSASNKTSLALKLPYTVYDIPVAVSFAFMAYYAAKRTLEDIRALSAGEEDEQE